MEMLWLHIKLLLREKLSFRLACAYLMLLTILVMVLPWLPIPYLPNELDLTHTYQAPFPWESKQPDKAFHWLGTDGLGRDMLANILYGARTAVFISIPVMLAVAAIGTLLGAFAAFYGNKKLKLSFASLLVLLLAFAAFVYYGLYLPSVAMLTDKSISYTLVSISIAIVIVLLAIKLLLPLLMKVQLLQRKLSIPADRLLIRLIELFTSIPKLILILALASFMAPSVYILIMLLIFTYWTGTARLARAETLKVKQLPFFEAAVALGVSDFKLVYRHVLPNMLAPLVVTFTFGVAGLMTLESTLSFLGIGIPGTLVSWGRTIAGIKSNTGAWWLVLLPGFFLALTVLALQTFSHHVLTSTGKRKAS
ncbi:ABC transporter permease [Pontibacter harenae]|uniref:ABC transporter permease n=1 Tax=Pontibacter harenae TaxID=2894083 RepID=UPI001E4259BE|nr:ABC transporter permease [Pontibacter harenae]MCC9167932.1 ABC transporter permease [Pontibacter harenae]